MTGDDAVRDQVIAGLREYLRRVTGSVGAGKDITELQFGIRMTSTIADDEVIKEMKATRRERAVSVAVYTELSNAEVGRLAGFSGEWVRTAVCEVLEVEKTKGPEYEAAKSRMRPVLEIDNAVDELTLIADVVRVAEACYAEGMSRRDQLLVRAKELDIDNETVRGWSRLSDSGVSKGRRRARGVLRRPRRKHGKKPRGTPLAGDAVD